MIVIHGRGFKKMFKKQPAFVQEKFEVRLSLYTQNTHHPLLDNHALNGEWDGCRSINITGDVRLVFEEVNENHIELVAIGTHSELYS